MHSLDIRHLEPLSVGFGVARTQNPGQVPEEARSHEPCEAMTCEKRDIPNVKGGDAYKANGLPICLSKTRDCKTRPVFRETL